jgi:hypothetical protein
VIFDNVDRDYPNANDSQAYNVKKYFPDADRGSILITSRLASLQVHVSGIKIEMVNTEQARAILQNNAGTAVEGELPVPFEQSKIYSLIYVE